MVVGAAIRVAGVLKFHRSRATAFRALIVLSVHGFHFRGKHEAVVGGLDIRKGNHAAELVVGPLGDANLLRGVLAAGEALVHKEHHPAVGGNYQAGVALRHEGFQVSLMQYVLLGAYHLQGFFLVLDLGHSP